MVGYKINLQKCEVFQYANDRSEEMKRRKLQQETKKQISLAIVSEEFSH